MKRRTITKDEKAGPRTRQPPPVYPFTSIVGQEEMKLALLLNAIDAAIGGVLIMGHRGTGKSTAVRALADLLPEIERVRDCFYACDPRDETGLCDDCHAQLSSGRKLLRTRSSVPVAELPLGATEDRVCGTVNIERALKEGIRAFEPGVLARANRGFLYIDEVNLLEDHLIDLLLDVAVTGRNVVEREGISVAHPARFRLVGSGNPEEGELRPQLLDRFGLHVEVKTTTDLDERVSVVEQREAFERDPLKFRALAEGEQGSLRLQLIRARKKLNQVELSSELLRRIAELCQRLQIDGHRGEITIFRAARALVAFEGRKSVTASDVRRVAAMALRHRLRRDPLEQTASGGRIAQQLDNLFPPNDENQRAGKNGSQKDDPPPNTPPGGEGSNGAGGRALPDKSAEGTRVDETERNAPPQLDAQLPEIKTDSSARVMQKRTSKLEPGRRRANERLRHADARRGRYVRAVSTKTAGAKIALDATLRTMAGLGMRAGEESASSDSDRQSSAGVSPQALRYKRFKRKAGTLFIFLIDTSGSMALNRIAQAKGALSRLLQQSYVRRDRLALICFRGERADVLLRPSGSAARAKRLLDTLSLGGATPLAAGLKCSLEVARQAGRESAERIILLLFTDGRANVSLRIREGWSAAERQRAIGTELTRIGVALRELGVKTIVVDTGNRFISNGEGEKLAEMVAGSYVYLSSSPSQSEPFAQLVRETKPSR